MQQRQQQYEHEQEKMEKEVVNPAADAAPLRYHHFVRIFCEKFCQDQGNLCGICLSLSVGVTQEDHDALLAEVQRLELDLGKIRQDLQGVVGCKGRCEQLDSLQETVSNTNVDSTFELYRIQSAFSVHKIYIHKILLTWSFH